MDGRDGGPPPGAVASTADTGGFHPGAKVWVAKDGDDGTSAVCNHMNPHRGKRAQALLELSRVELLSDSSHLAPMSVQIDLGCENGSLLRVVLTGVLSSRAPSFPLSSLHC